MIRLLTSFGYVGLLRPAPGTWGSAAGLALGIGLHWLGGFPLLALATLGVAVLEATHFVTSSDHARHGSAPPHAKTTF